MLESSLVRMSVQASAFTNYVSHHKLFCGSVKGLVNSLPAQFLEFLQVVPHKGYCVRCYPKGCAAERHLSQKGSGQFSRVILKQQSLLHPTQNLLLGFNLLWISLLPKLGSLGFFFSLSQLFSIFQ